MGDPKRDSPWQHTSVSTQRKYSVFKTTPIQVVCSRALKKGIESLNIVLSKGSNLKIKKSKGNDRMEDRGHEKGDVQVDDVKGHKNEKDKTLKGI